jgi:acetolactate synthase-1/2/3 large subunit
MKLSDYIAQFLAERGITHAFGMSGGAAVHMFDSIDRRPDIEIVSMTHEQCAAMAADGYARASGKMGVAICTSGPGATNLLTGTCCSYYDSIPTLMLTGQVSTHRLKGLQQVRQLGFQETDVVSIFKSVTKYAVQLKEAKDIRLLLEEAFYIAFEGRPGPVLIDIPDDLQRSEIEPKALIGFHPPSQKSENEHLDRHIAVLLSKIEKATRPVLVLGGGLKTPFVGGALMDCVERLGIPVLVTWAGLDLLPANHPLRIGTFGVYGSRAGNMTIQNSDLVIALGTRLSQNLTGGILTSFAREASIVMVDVDEHEMNKFDGKGIQIDLRIKTKLNNFIEKLKIQLNGFDSPDWSSWLGKLDYWKHLFPKDHSPQPVTTIPFVDANEFVIALSDHLPADALLYVDTGGNLTWTCNSLATKSCQGVHSAWNHTPMGYALPASIGAALHNQKGSITCITGDGGLMICLAELASVAHHKLPIKIFLFNNHSHGIQKQTLETWLGGRKVGVDSSSGVAFPKDWIKVAESFGLETFTINNMQSLDQLLTDVYGEVGPVFINVEINPEQKLYPVLKFGEALENQMPQLERINLDSEMLIPPFQKIVRTIENIDQSSQGW